VNIIKIICIPLVILALASCRSKPPQLYVLNPLPCIKSSKNTQFSSLRIGLDAIKIPEYIQKPEIVLHCNKNEVKLAKNHEWAEGLDKNILRIFQTNLMTLLPGAIVEITPWNSRFKADYNVQIIISEFETDQNRNIFRAEYLIYQGDNIIKGNVCYKNKIMEVTPKNVVLNLNEDITALTQEIASFFRKHLQPKFGS
jgi:uncharacterized lipoprotein YmbA